jgi:hypothetical protein
VQQEQPDGTIKDKHRQGFKGLGFRLVLGQDLLPSTLHTGLLLVTDAGEVVAFYRDPLHDEVASSDLDKFPGVGQFGLSAVISRSSTSGGRGQGQKDDIDLLALCDDALGLIAEGKADYLRGSPFVRDELGDHLLPGLLDVLDEVSLLGVALVANAVHHHIGSPVLTQCLHRLSM